MTTDEPQETDKDWATLLVKIPIDKGTEYNDWFTHLALEHITSANLEHRNFRFVERIDADIKGMEGQYDYLVYSAEIIPYPTATTTQENPQ